MSTRRLEQPPRLLYPVAVSHAAEFPGGPARGTPESGGESAGHSASGSGRLRLGERARLLACQSVGRPLRFWPLLAGRLCTRGPGLARARGTAGDSRPPADSSLDRDSTGTEPQRGWQARLQASASSTSRKGPGPSGASRQCQRELTASATGSCHWQWCQWPGSLRRSQARAG